MGERGLLGLHFSIFVHHKRKSGQELEEPGADAEAKEGGAYGLVPPGLLSLIS